MFMDQDFVIKNGVLKKYVGNGENVVIPDDVVEIAGDAFIECKHIVSVTMPKSITKIGSWAYARCSALETINIPQGITRISDRLFCFCSSLTTLEVPDGVTKIGEIAFGHCTSLSNITLPNSLTIIGESAFAHCKNLKSIVIPESVKEIGRRAFYSCESLSSVMIPGAVKKIGLESFENCQKLYSLCAPKLPFDIFKENGLQLPASVGYMLNSELYDNDKISEEYKKYISAQKKRIIPLLFENDSIKGIKLYAEMGKITLKNFDEDFLNPALSANATQCIAFLMDWKEKNVTQDHLEKQFVLELTDDSFKVSDMKKIWSYEKLQDGTIEITGYKGKDTKIEIPERIGSSIVTSIAKEAFSCYKSRRTAEQKSILENITKVTLPKTVVNIGEEAFRGCIGLKDKNGFIIFRDVLYDYYGTDCDIVIPDGIRRIDARAFAYKINIDSVKFSNTVTEIGDYAFEGCLKLKSIVWPKRIESIGEGAFCMCSFTSISIPYGVTKIKKQTFNNCLWVEKIIIPDSVVKIEDKAFTSCRELEYIFIPETVMEIGKSAFIWCDKLTIKTKLGSYAEKFAKENNIPIVAE